MTTEYKAKNRSVTLDGANKIFSVVGVTIEKDERLEIYESSGLIEIKARTLTEACQLIAKGLLSAQA